MGDALLNPTLTGRELGGYRVESEIGRGAMGVVYRAEHIHLRRAVALKVIAPEHARNDAFRDRFLRESRIAAALEHPNVVPVLDAGEAGGVLFLAMRHVEGSDLGALLRSEGRLEPDRAIAIVAQVAAALDAAHAHGLVHRDVKPGNILIAPPEHAFLTDFGVSHEMDGTLRPRGGAGTPAGTLAYLAPEQIEDGPVDGRADAYALGCVLFELLTGATPFAASPGPRHARAAAAPGRRAARAARDPRRSRSRRQPHR